MWDLILASYDDDWDRKPRSSEKSALIKRCVKLFNGK